VARVRLSATARADIDRILDLSAERWGGDGRRRYAALLARAIRMLASRPLAPSTRDRAKLAPGLRSLHLRHARTAAIGVAAPVHVACYRVVDRVVEVVRILHERIDPSAALRKS
jgi:toxin ParE1/3/4